MREWGGSWRRTLFSFLGLPFNSDPFKIFRGHLLSYFDWVHHSLGWQEDRHKKISSDRHCELTIYVEVEFGSGRLCFRERSSYLPCARLPASGGRRAGCKIPFSILLFSDTLHCILSSNSSPPTFTRNEYFALLVFSSASIQKWIKVWGPVPRACA